MAKTKIEWAQRVWNPITGCTKLSDGCWNCYAERMAKRLAGRCGYDGQDPFKITFHPERLTEPETVKEPSVFFVSSMGDLFHPDVPDEYIENVFAVMETKPRHTYMLLTKRPARMAEFINNPTGKHLIRDNVWLGATVENQKAADERIPHLMKVRAAVRYLSVEPMIGPLDLRGKLCHYTNPDGTGSWFTPVPGKVQKRLIDLVICGGETGPGARPMHPKWVRSLRDQCVDAGVPFFFKQWGEFCAPSQMTEGMYRAWDYHHGTENCWREDDPRWRVSKNRAGRLLDGREWNEWPGETE